MRNQVHILRYCIICILLLVLGTSKALADGVNVTKLAFFLATNPNSTQTHGIIQNGRAYCGASNVFEIFDITNPTQPTRLGSYTFPNAGVFTPFAVSGNVAYISSFGSLFLLDVSNPANPSLLSTTPAGNGPAAVIGSLLYIAVSSGLQIYDVADPHAPVLLSRYFAPDPLYYGRGISVVGSYAYVTQSDHGLHIIDVSDPVHPVLAGTYWDESNLGDVVSDGSVAYYAANTDGVKVIDVSEPTSPTLIATYDPYLSGVHLLALSGHYLYAATFNAQLHVLDVSDPAAPILKGISAQSIRGDQMGAEGNYVITPSGNSYYLLQFTDNGPIIPTPIPTATPSPTVSPTPSPVPVGENVTLVGRMTGQYKSVAVEGSRAYLANNTGLFVVDVSNPLAPHGLGTLEWGETNIVASGRVAVSGSLACVVLTLYDDPTSLLKIVDVTDSAAPTLAATFSDHEITAVILDGHLAYVGEVDYNFGAPWPNYQRGVLAVLDLSQPTSPQLLKSYPFLDRCLSLALDGSLLFASLSPGPQPDGVPIPTPPQTKPITVLDISNPSSPVHIGDVDSISGDPHGMRASGSILSVGSIDCQCPPFGFSKIYGFIDAYDYSDPHSPVRVGTFADGRPGSMARDGEIVYVLEDDDEDTPGQRLRVLDISDPATPISGGSYPLIDGNTSPSRVDTENGLIYLIDGAFGLLILDYTPPSPTPTASPTPAPLNAAVLQSQSIPTDIPAQHDVEAHITLQNTGNTVWNFEQGYALAVLEDANSLSSPTQRIAPDPLDEIAPGQMASFAFRLHGPSASGGISTITLQMLQDGVGTFGPVIQASLNVVEPNNEAQFMSTSLPSSLPPNQIIGIGVSVRNTGNTTWFPSDNDGSFDTAARAGGSPQVSLGVIEDACSVMGGISIVPMPAGDVTQHDWQFIFFVHTPTASQTCTLKLRMVELRGPGFTIFGDPIDLVFSVEPPSNATSNWAEYE